MNRSMKLSAALCVSLLSISSASAGLLSKGLGVFVSYVGVKACKGFLSGMAPNTKKVLEALRKEICAIGQSAESCSKKAGQKMRKNLDSHKGSKVYKKLKNIASKKTEAVKRILELEGESQKKESESLKKESEAQKKE